MKTLDDKSNNFFASYHPCFMLSCCSWQVVEKLFQLIANSSSFHELQSTLYYLHVFRSVLFLNLPKEFRRWETSLNKRESEMSSQHWKLNYEWQPGLPLVVLTSHFFAHKTHRCPCCCCCCWHKSLQNAFSQNAFMRFLNLPFLL